MENRRIAGNIIQGNIVVSFVGEEHNFTFVRADMNPSSCSSITLKAKNGFVEGRTDENKRVLIFTHDDLKIWKTKKLSTWLYIVASDSNQKLSECDGIQFVGGALKSLFRRSSLQVKNPLEWELAKKDDTITAPIKTEKVDEIAIRSVVSGENSLREGLRIDNSQIELQLLFAQKRDVCDTFQEEYNTILELCCFLTFRRYAAFDRVFIVSQGSVGGTMDVIGECYVRRESEYDVNRDPVRCITFNDIKPYLKELYLMVRNRNEKKSRYCVDFIPETPKDFNRVTPELIRKVCASAELETRVRKIPVAKNEHFVELKKKIKEVIDQSKESEEGLTEKEYDYINGAFSFLDGPLEERMKNLYDLYKDCIGKIITDYEIAQITETEIHEMIKVRNGMSHGSAITSIDVEAYTAKAFMGIIYASVLSRCNCSKEEIKEWIDGGLLTVGDI